MRNSEILSSVYDELLQMDHGTQVEDLKKVQDEIREDEPEGAFFCSYPVFHSIYQLEARRLERLGAAEYVLLLTIELTDIPNVPNADQIRRFKINQAVEKLEPVIQNSLRSGDIATRCSDSQYMVLLLGCDYEHAQMVAERMLESYRKSARSQKNVHVSVALEEIAPDDNKVRSMPDRRHPEHTGGKADA